MISFDQPLPHDPDAEASLLCACLLDTQSLMDAIDCLLPNDFYSSKHRVIFQSLIDCCPKVASNRPDIALVASKAKGAGVPMSFLMGLQETPMAVDIKEISRIIKNKSLVRKTIQVSVTGIKSLIASNGDANEVIDEYQQRVLAIESSTSGYEAFKIADIVSSNIDNYELASTMGGVTGITTGFTDLDAVLGGLHKSDLIILAARPSMGKTSMALNIIENCGVPAMFFSLEMARNQLVDRMLSGKSGINLTKLVTGKLNGADWIEINNAAEAVSSLPILIDDSPSLHFSEIRRRARIAFKQIGIKLIVVDYLQLMRGNESKNGNRETEVSNISRALKAIAKELNIPVIALAQLNRDLEKRSNKRPELSDLRESGSIEQDADIVMFIYREEVYTKANTPEELKNKAEIIVAKHRNGPTGFAMLSFDKSTTTFRNLYRR
jgi:replicative DNA helicase